METVESDRLTLVASTLAPVRTELEVPAQRAQLFYAAVSPDWPTGECDRDAMEFFRARFEEQGEAAEGWYGWYALRRADAEGPRALVGAGGYFGPAAADGTVEIGYSVLSQWQRRGYALEIIGLLLKNAFSCDHIHCVIAPAVDGDLASTSVLRACGFQPAGQGREDGTVRLEFTRGMGA